MTLTNSMLNQNNHYDLVMIGAGAANLSLVLALKESNYEGSVLILERSDKLPNNRIWSFWYHPTLPKHITSLISHKWVSWSVSIGTSCAIMNAPTMPYCSITAETLSDAALAVIDKSANYSLLLSCDVVSIEHKKNTISVITPSAKFECSQVIDTRPPIPELPNVGLLQSFYGMEIKTESAFFTPSKVDLMHKLHVSNNRLEFFYILPFSESHALLEYTCFTRENIPKMVLKHQIEAFVTKYINGTDYSLVRTESGVLPMYNITPPANKKNVIRAGISGGAMRASTGYCFSSIQTWAEQTAAMLVNAEPLKQIIPIPNIYRWMDDLFLRVLCHNMNIAPVLFYDLTKKLSAPRFARFMTEKASVLDLLSIIWCMPKLIFLKALFNINEKKQVNAKKK